MTGVDCLTDGHTFISQAHPDRAVQAALFGLAIYQDGVRVGLVMTQNEAADWLEGKPLDEVPHFKVVDAPCEKEPPCP